MSVYQANHQVEGTTEVIYRANVDLPNCGEKASSIRSGCAGD